MQGSRQAGFSLLEMLVTLIVIVLITSLVSLAINSGGQEIQLEAKVRNLQEVAAYAVDEAQLMGRDYGLLLQQEMVERDTVYSYQWRERLPEDYARFRRKDPDYDFGSGERLLDFFARAIACVGEVAARHPGEAVLVFTHGGVLEMVYRHALGRGLQSERDFEIPNAAINRVEVASAGWRVREWASTGHLDRALDDLPG